LGGQKVVMVLVSAFNENSIKRSPIAGEVFLKKKLDEE
jgi:hypothetical protein